MGDHRWSVLVRQSEAHEWFELCRCDSPDSLAEVIRILAAQGAGGPGELQVRRLEG